jgi:hypothetical protein
MKKAGTCTLIALGILFLQAQDASAHHPSVGFGLGTAGPVLTIPAIPMARNSWSAAIRSDSQKFDRFSDPELESLAASGTDTHSMDSQTSVFFSAAYGVTEDLTVGMHIPYVIRRGIREGHLEGGTPEVHDHGNSEGIGDLSLVGQYRIWRAEKSGADVSILFGLKTPTGDTKVTDRQGVRFETEFQPGSDSWDPLVGAAAGRRIGKTSLDMSALYAIATEGAHDTDLGDALHFGLALSRRYTPAHGDPRDPGHSHEYPPGASHPEERAGYHSHISFEFILEATGEWRQKQTVSGVRDPDSGGMTVLLSPGIRANIYDHFAAFVSAGFPVIQDLNGTQHETRTSVTFGISAGL